MIIDHRSVILRVGGYWSELSFYFKFNLTLIMCARIYDPINWIRRARSALDLLPRGPGGADLADLALTKHTRARASVWTRADLAF